MTRLASNHVDHRIGAHMIIKPDDLADAVTYHTGTFPLSALDYEVVLRPLEEAAASLARYDAKMSGMMNSELFVAPLRRQDAVTSSRVEGTISTIEERYRLEAEEDAGSADPYREARNDDVQIRTAIAHAEFEALHPFEYGNGRIGRMLITLML